MGGTVHVYSVKDLRVTRAIVVHPFAGFDVAFTADGKGLITCQSHPVLWDLATGDIVRHFGPFNDLCHSVDVSPDGKFVVSTSMASDVKIWEIATGVFHRRLGIDVKPRGDRSCQLPCDLCHDRPRAGPRRTARIVM
jgi:WD40 repeat protein